MCCTGDLGEGDGEEGVDGGIRTSPIVRDVEKDDVFCLCPPGMIEFTC